MSSHVLPGRCGAKCVGKSQRLGTVEYCENKPLYPDERGGNGRCKFHGGLSTGPLTKAGKERVAKNAFKHSLYAQTLRSNLREDEKKLFDSLNGETDLTNEIDLARIRVTRCEEYLRKQIDAGADHATIAHFEERVERAKELVRRLAATQHDMHPANSLQGNLNIKVSVSAEAQAKADEDVPELEADGAAESAPDQVAVVEPVIDSIQGKFDEDFGDDP